MRLQVRMLVTLPSDAVTILYASGISRDAVCILKLIALVGISLLFILHWYLPFFKYDIMHFFLCHYGHKLVYTRTDFASFVFYAS